MPAAIATAVFLASIGINVHIDQGYPASGYIAPLQYLGAGAARTGYSHIDQSVLVHQQTGVRFSIFGGCNLANHFAAARTLAAAGGLLALEGPNEPNNFPVTYNGQAGGSSGTYLPVARCMADMMAQSRADATLKAYPVFGSSEASGAETDNVGLQFLTIPIGAGVGMPDGTAMATHANAHNYASGNGCGYRDNQAWGAADPVLRGCWDGLAGLYGVTWRGHFAGYSNTDLPALPRVTTETGWDTASNIGGEDLQGKIITNTYLAQFARGWAYTMVYQAIDGEGGGGAQGLFHADHTPKLAATYIHNLTTVLGGGDPAAAGTIGYSIAGQALTTHALALVKRPGVFDLVVWGEKTAGSVSQIVSLGSAYAVKVYDVTQGTAPIASYASTSSVIVNVADHALIIEATAAAGVPPPPPPPSVTAAAVQAALDRIAAELAAVRADVGKLSP